MEITILVSSPAHIKYVDVICEMINHASQKRGTGIALRTPAYLAEKISHGRAIVALHGDIIAGFCYLETWSHNKYVANSGLIVAEGFRKTGLASAIKLKAFELSCSLFPEAKLFGITTSLPVMKINSNLGYKPVTFSELTDDNAFWDGCKSCNNHDILIRNNRNMCLCTGMLYDPKSVTKQTKSDRIARWGQFKRFLKLRKIRAQRKIQSITIFS